MQATKKPATKPQLGLPPINPFPMIDERPDYLVTCDTIRQVEEYSHPKDGYEVLIGIPAAFTPVCAEEMEALNKGIPLELPYEVAGVTRIVMLDNPHSVQAWLRDNRWENLQVLISPYCASSNEMTTGDAGRPMQRTVVVNFYEPREAENPIERMVSDFGKFPFVEPMRFARTIELLRYQTHMDIPRNFQEVQRVISHHAENRLA